MPERWQDELKKLRREEMPDGVRDRAEAGPRRELPSDGRQRLVAGVVAFAVFIAAGAFAWQAFDGGDQSGVAQTPAPDAPTAVITLLEGDPDHPGTPGAYMAFEGDRIQGWPMSFTWGSTIYDTFIPEFKDPIRLPKGTFVEVAGDAGSVSFGVVQGHSIGRVDPLSTSSDTFELPLADGKYLLQASATWPQGTVQFYFPIVVEVDDPSVVLTLSSADLGPAAVMSSGGVEQAGMRPYYDWCDGSGECVTGYGDPADPDHPVSEFLVVPAGAEIRVDGDGSVTRFTVRADDASPADPAFLTDVSEPPLPVPEEPGRYVVRVEASWDAGSAEFVFGIEVLPETADIPDILHLTCTPDRATLDANVVQVQADGLHIVVDASADVAGADFITGTTPEEFFGIGLDERDDGTRGYSIAPGEWGVGCYERARGAVGPSDLGTPSVASFTVIDPDDRYAEPDVTCSDPQTTVGATGLLVGPPPTADEVSRALAGLGTNDVVREAGYDNADGFKLGPTYVVQRSGQTIARITLGSAPDDALSDWAATIEACPGSGIILDPQSEALTPDVAVLRCAADGPELDTPIVQVQPDGLHVDATNETTAFLIDVEPEGGENVGVDAFDGTGQREVVIPVPPGPALIGCLYLSDDEVVAGGSDDRPDWYVPIEIRDPESAYRSSELSCARTEQVPLRIEGNAIGEPVDEGLIRSRIGGILPSDIVERSGYPASTLPSASWRVVRDGQVLALIADSHLDGTVCSGSGIGVP